MWKINDFQGFSVIPTPPGQEEKLPPFKPEEECTVSGFCTSLTPSSQADKVSKDRKQWESRRNSFFPPSVYQGMWNSLEQLPSLCARWHWEQKPCPGLAPAAPREKCTQGGWWQQKQTFHPSALSRHSPSCCWCLFPSELNWGFQMKGAFGVKNKTLPCFQGKKKHTQKKENTHTKKPLQTMNMQPIRYFRIRYFRISIFHILHRIIKYPEFEGTYKGQCPPKDSPLLKDCHLQK